MTTSSISEGTPSVAKLREASDVELLERMAKVCSTVDAHMKEINERIEANPDEHPATAPPAKQSTKKLFAKLAAHDKLFSMLGEGMESF